jgi:hypothetical protein
MLLQWMFRRLPVLDLDVQIHILLPRGPSRRPPLVLMSPRVALVLHPGVGQGMLHHTDPQVKGLDLQLSQQVGTA